MSGHPPQSQQPEPLNEVRALLVINQQLIDGIEKSQRGTAIDADLALQKIGTINTDLAVITNRIERIEQDYKDSKQQAQTWKIVAWSAVLAAVLSVVAPLVIRPTGVSPTGAERTK